MLIRFIWPCETDREHLESWKRKHSEELLNPDSQSAGHFPETLDVRGVVEASMTKALCKAIHKHRQALRSRLELLD